MKNSRINADWHRANKMPARATLDQRVEWHLEHQKNCRCRTDLPESIRVELDRRAREGRGAKRRP